MPTFKDRTGQRFGRLLVTGPAVRKARRVYWTCRCDCGNERVVFAGSLGSGLSRSCGCLRSELTAERNETHRARGEPEYAVWAAMRNRCLNPSDQAYRHYGGRGITVAARWDSFEAFLSDMGPRPTPDHQIERVDNGASYSPTNCRWASRSENCRNRRNNRVIEHAGLKLTLAEWADRTGLKSHTIANRIDRLGWPAARALTTPPRFDRRHHQTRE